MILKYYYKIGVLKIIILDTYKVLVEKGNTYFNFIIFRWLNKTMLIKNNFKYHKEKTLFLEKLKNLKSHIYGYLIFIN